MEMKSSNNSAVRVAVVGVGYWGKNLVRNFHELGALEALCDAADGAEAANKLRYNGVRFESEYTKLLNDPQITAIALATPAVTHYEMAKAALLAGKDVLVEKPLAIDVKHGEELIKVDPKIIAGAKANSKKVTRSAGGALAWPGLLRKLDRLDPSYRS